MCIRFVLAGCLPAVETPDGIAGQSDDRYDDLAAASSVIEFLCTSRGLNSELPGHVCAESEAFTCLLDSHLSNAVRYSTWCEWSSLSQLPVRSIPPGDLILFGALCRISHALDSIYLERCMISELNSSSSSSALLPPPPRQVYERCT